MAKKCPQGHSLDPNWEKCPYCEAQKRAKQKTSEAAVFDSAPNRKGTVVGKIPPSADKRKTKTMASEDSFGPGGHVGEGETRRIVGVLISYTWQPEGVIYPVREGRTYIGRDKISNDPYHRNCDVMVPEDDRMSGTHALILCRHGNYEIIDQEASNGTFLNGNMLMANTSTKLDNYAEIKTGRTLWAFIKIDISRTAQSGPPPEQQPPPPREDDETRGDTIVR